MKFQACNRYGYHSGGMTPGKFQVLNILKYNFRLFYCVGIALKIQMRLLFEKLTALLEY